MTFKDHIQRRKRNAYWRGGQPQHLEWVLIHPSPKDDFFTAFAREWEKTIRGSDYSKIIILPSEVQVIPLGNG